MFLALQTMLYIAKFLKDEAIDTEDNLLFTVVRPNSFKRSLKEVESIYTSKLVGFLAILSS